MNAIFWRQVHGGLTHFPIALLLTSVVCDLIAWRSRDAGLRRGLHAAGFGSAIVGMLGGVGAAVAGLFMARGQVLGVGYQRTHHLFVWPAIILAVVLVAWRLLGRGRIPARGFGAYFVGMSVAAVLMVGAGYSGGEMLLAAESGNEPALPASSRPAPPSGDLAPVRAGQRLFLKNCAHCHGADAHGDDGPDLHNLDWTDEQIASRIRKGKKGQMTAFGGKFSEEDIREVIAYLRALK